MLLIVWLVVGVVAGVLASAFVSYRSYGLVADAVVGMLGAIIGSWLVGAFRIQTPLDGWPRTILVAFIGAATLLTVLRLASPRRRFAWSR